ncbi:MAG: nicotinate-nucleotide adenylyltransferase [Cyanobacteria bacterium J06623_7]
MNKIALFGTSADPPTVGHQTILYWLAQHYDRVVVWASDNPFKQHQTPLTYRSEMLELAIAELNLNRIKLYPELSDRFTLITVNRARERWGKEIDFSLVVGSDILPQMPNWYRIEELLAQVKVLIIPRIGYGIEPAELMSLSNLGGEYAIASLNAPKVSSSTYRLQKDQSLVIPSVRDYIYRQNLYGVVSEVRGKR